jgi:hypothetical protein
VAHRLFGVSDSLTVQAIRVADVLLRRLRAAIHDDLYRRITAVEQFGGGVPGRPIRLAGCEIQSAFAAGLEPLVT